MNFPNNCICRRIIGYMLVLIPAVRVCRIEVNNHSSITIDTNSLGINIAGFLSLAVSCYNICVVGILNISKNCIIPNTIITFKHFQIRNDSCTLFDVTSCCITLKVYLFCTWCPYLESSFFFGIVSTEVISVISLFIKLVRVFFFGSICRIWNSHCYTS